MKRIVLLPLICALLLACQDQRSMTGVKGPSADLRDGAHNGNRHFFFLPPLVTQPSLSGVFNPGLNPVVVICQLDVGPAPQNTPIGCSEKPPVVVLTAVADLAGQQYKVNWNTTQPAIDPNQFYRIQVFGSLDGTLLGFADVDPVNNGSQLKNVNTGEYIGLVDGRTLPIKFRIERGALTGSGDCTDCAEQTVGPAGGTVITNTSLAGVFFPPGALPRDVTVIIEATPPAAGQSCIPVTLDQFPGCYTFATDPGPTTFSTSVTAAICVETGTLTADQIRSLILYQLDVVGERDVITPLENTPAAFLPCNSLARATPGRDGILGLALAGLDAVRSLIVPATLNAAHVGVGGLTGSFSRIGWGLPPTITGVAGTNNQTAAPGSTVPNPPAVQLMNSSEGFVQGLPVKFKVTSGGGRIVLGNESLAESTVVVSNVDGIAAIAGWQLGPTAGANTLQASQIGAIGSPVTFTATGLTSITIDFDVTPTGAAVTPGTVVNSVYASQGITFTKLGPGTNCGTGPQVYANGDNPGGVGNTVSTCPQGIASDISANSFGVIQATFAMAASGVCIDVRPPGTGFAFLESFDAAGASLGRTTSSAGVTQPLCISRTGIRSVQFSGAGDNFARFDNLVISF